MRNYFPDPSGWASYQRNQPEYELKVKAFAVKLHNVACRLDHNDQCTWLYESDPGYPNPTWDCWAHKKYYAKALNLLSSGAPEDLILDIIKEVQ